MLWVKALHIVFMVTWFAGLFYLPRLFWPGGLVRDFSQDRNRRSHVFYRWINEIPAASILILVVILVVLKPF